MLLLLRGRGHVTVGRASIVGSTVRPLGRHLLVLRLLWRECVGLLLLLHGLLGRHLLRMGSIRSCGGGGRRAIRVGGSVRRLVVGRGRRGHHRRSLRLRLLQLRSVLRLGRLLLQRHWLLVLLGELLGGDWLLLLLLRLWRRGVANGGLLLVLLLGVRLRLSHR